MSEQESAVQAPRPSRALRARVELDTTRLTFLGGVLVVAAAVAAFLWTFPDAIRTTHGAIGASATTPLVERQLAGANAVDVSRDFLVAAKALVPAGATFDAVTGPNVQVSTPLTLDALPALARFWLLPRRMTTENPDWLLCYGCDMSSFQSHVDVVWDQHNGLLIGRFRR